jgi:hypothetical protein
MDPTQTPDILSGIDPNAGVDQSGPAAGDASGNASDAAAASVPGTPAATSGINVIGSLDSLANSAISSIGGAVTQSVTQAVRTQGAAPAPDLAAASAKSAVSTFAKSSVAGVSAPVALVGIGALLYLMMKKRVF